MPLDFLKRKKGELPGATPAAAAATGSVVLPEEVVAQEYQLKLDYAGKSSEGVRMKTGPGAMGELPSMLVGLAKSEIEVVEPLPIEFSQATPTARPSEAMRTMSTRRSPATRWSSSSPSMRWIWRSIRSCARSSRARSTRAGTPSTTRSSGAWPRTRTRRRATWSAAPSLGWGGRGVRGDTDRIGARLLAGILTNILASQYALGLTAIDRPVPAAGRGGLVCAHCGFASAHERAFYCPKCGMRLLRG